MWALPLLSGGVMHGKTDERGLTLLHEETTAARCRWLAILLLMFTLVWAGSTPTATPAAPASSPTLSSAAPSVSNDVCLGCHGPYDKVAKATAKYTLQDGSVVNPHTTIDRSASKPHTTGQGVPECTQCHTPHPVPLASRNDVVKANVEYCYSCHHQRNFMPCTQCHN